MRQSEEGIQTRSDQALLLAPCLGCSDKKNGWTFAVPFRQDAMQTASDPRVDFTKDGKKFVSSGHAW